MESATADSGQKVVDAQLVETEISQELGDVVDRARQIVAGIKDDATRDEAARHGVVVATKEKNLKTLREKHVTPLRKAYEGIRDLFDGSIRQLEATRRVIAQGVSAYDIEQERKARIAREEAERKARQEREEYERKRREHEEAVKRQKEEEARQERERQQKILAEKAERDRKLKEEEDARLRHAQEAQAQGNVQKVEPILDKTTAIAPAAPAIPQTPVASTTAAVIPPAPLPPPPPPPALPPVVARRPDDMTTKRDEWKWDLSKGDREDLTLAESKASLLSLAKAVAEGRAPVEYLALNRAEIGRDVKKLKDEFVCDGLRAWKERNTAFKVAKEEFDA